MPRDFRLDVIAPLQDQFAQDTRAGIDLGLRLRERAEQRVADEGDKARERAAKREEQLLAQIAKEMQAAQRDEASFRKMVAGRLFQGAAAGQTFAPETLQAAGLGAFALGGALEQQAGRVRDILATEIAGRHPLPVVTPEQARRTGIPETPARDIVQQQAAAAAGRVAGGVAPPELVPTMFPAGAATAQSASAARAERGRNLRFVEQQVTRAAADFEQAKRRARQAFQDDSHPRLAIITSALRGLGNLQRARTIYDNAEVTVRALADEAARRALIAGGQTQTTDHPYLEYLKFLGRQFDPGPTRTDAIQRLRIDVTVPVDPAGATPADVQAGVAAVQAIQAGPPPPEGDVVAAMRELAQQFGLSDADVAALPARAPEGTHSRRSLRLMAEALARRRAQAAPSQ